MWLLAAILTGQFMAILDASIVNVATPSIRIDLGASGAALQLVVAGYTIAYAVLLITGARLGGRLGYRRSFMAGLGVFTAASLACGLAPTAETLIAFRAVQGAGAALLVPQVFSLIQRTFTGNDRARALSLYAAVIAMGALVGQVLGGVLVSADLFGTAWRPVFLVNVPIGAALLLVTPRVVQADRPERGRPLDLGGLVTLALAVLLLVVPLVLGHEEQWPAWTFVSMATSGVLLVAFAMVERRVDARGGSPLIRGRVLRAPGMLAANVALFCGMIAYGGFLFTFAQHLQAGLHDSALVAGLTVAPAATGFGLASLFWRRLPPDWQRRIIPVGFAVAALGYAGTGLLLGDGSPGGFALPVVLAIAGLGMGAAFSPALAIALQTVAPADAPDASGLLTTVVQLGQVVGVATFGSVFLSLATSFDATVTGHALEVTLGLVAVATAASAVTGLRLARPASVPVTATVTPAATSTSPAATSTTPAAAPAPAPAMAVGLPLRYPPGTFRRAADRFATRLAELERTEMDFEGDAAE